MRTVAVLLPMLVLWACGPRPDEPNDCRNPDLDEEIRGLDIGTVEPYASIQDGDPFETEIGGQGSRMFRMALRIREDGPSCLDQTTTLVDGNGDRIGRLSSPLKTHVEGNFRYTDPMPIPISVHSETTAEITVKTEAHGKTVSRVLIRDIDTGESTYYTYR